MARLCACFSRRIYYVPTRRCAGPRSRARDATCAPRWFIYLHPRLHFRDCLRHDSASPRRSNPIPIFKLELGLLQLFGSATNTAAVIIIATMMITMTRSMNRLLTALGFQDERVATDWPIADDQILMGVLAVGISRYGFMDSLISLLADLRASAGCRGCAVGSGASFLR